MNQVLGGLQEGCRFTSAARWLIIHLAPTMAIASYDLRVFAQRAAEDTLLGGSWVVISGVISHIIIWVTTIVT